jgi:hypothetical protein
MSCPEQWGRQGSLILYFGVTMLKVRNIKKRIAHEMKHDDGFGVADIIDSTCETTADWDIWYALS